MSANRQWRSFDWPLLACVALLVATGLACIFSATHGTFRQGEFQKQLFFLLPAIGALIFCMTYDYAWLFNFSRVIYWINAGLLAFVLVGGHSALGAQRWIKLGPLTLQPSEFAKLALIVTLAKLLSMRSAKNPMTLGHVALHVGLPALLVFKQPDLGTSLVFGAITVGMLFWAGISPAILFAVFSPFLSLATNAIGWPVWVAYLLVFGLWCWRLFPVHWGWRLTVFLINVVSVFTIPHLWNLLKPYQRQRLVVFLNPEADPLGSGYHIIQSKVAIGAGGLWGRGFLHGSQTQLHFIPEQHTDFIFSVIGEELGLIGGVALIALFMFLAWRALAIAKRAKDDFGSLLAVGILSMLMFHFFINVGMATGIMPVTGIPLPFVSAGGTSLVTNLAAVGLLLGIGMRRRKLKL